MTRNLTVGPPGPLIISFAVPLVIGNLFQQFYNMADSFIVGNTINMEALAAIGCSASLNFLILGFMMGVTGGASIITSQRFGANDEAGVRKSFAASIVLCAIVTVVLTIISVVALMPVLRLLNTPENIIQDAYDYFVIILWGMPAIALFNLLSNIMRAVGDNKTPLYFLIAACVINIVLDYVFILGFHTGVAGAGVATVIAQLVSGLACIPAIKKRLPQICPLKEDQKVSISELIEHSKTAFPVGFQMSIIAIGTVAVQYALNGLGSTAVAAFTTAEKIDQFATMPLASYGQAMTIYSAQNFGARKYNRIRQGVFQGAIISCIFSVIMFFLFVILGKSFAGLFLKGEAEAIDLAYQYLVIIGIFFFALALLFTFRQSLQGLGDGVTPTISGITELVMRTAAAIFLTNIFGFVGLCFASPLAFVGALAPLGISWYFKTHQLKRMSMKAQSR
ncbi:MAG: MATE family efflux transporter [Termitinemataceae bacterium]|nr:MAG: MATE family efflux transporter [Termitinemataceae bacterium]